MKIVADTNRLIAALIKDGASRAILRNPEYEFFTPDFALEEIWKHRDEIQKKAGISEIEFIVFLFLLFHRVTPLSSERYNKQLDEAMRIIGQVDKDDAPFIAAAIELDAGIWSDDRDFEKQSEVQVFKTRDLVKE